MAYLARNVEVRLDPARFLPGVRALIMVADRYARRGGHDTPLPPGHGRIARYARGEDYHVVIRRRLTVVVQALRRRFPRERFRVFVDTAPVLEREHAAAAGLGWIGRHTLLIHPRLGSYLLLGGIATTLALEPPPEQPVVTDHCGTCTRCLQACPTGAIGHYTVDASRCLAYLTIERRLPVPPEYFGPIGQWLFGCDVCQEVCPHNRAPRERCDESGDVPEAYRPQRTSFDLLEVLGWDERDRQRHLAGRALERATLAMMQRNALIVATNLALQAGDRTWPMQLGQIARDESRDRLVRETACALLAQLGEAPESPGVAPGSSGDARPTR